MSRPWSLILHSRAPNNFGHFVKSSARFFSHPLYHTLLAMSEVTDSFSGRSGRPCFVKDIGLALFRLVVVRLAQLTADIQVLFFDLSTFNLVAYFMVGLTMPAAKLFTYWIIVFAVATVRLHLTPFSRILAGSGVVCHCSVPSFRCHGRSHVRLSNGPFSFNSMQSSDFERP